MINFQERARGILSRRLAWFHGDECANDLAVALERVVYDAVRECDRYREALQAISDVDSGEPGWEPNFMQALADAALAEVTK